MRHDGFRAARQRNRAAELDRGVCHIVHGNGGQCRAIASALLGLEDERAAAASSVGGGVAICRRDRRGHASVGGPVVQLGQGRGEIIGVDEFVRGVLEGLLPTVRRGWGRADEKQLARIGERQVLVLVQVQRRLLAKVDAAPLAHDGPAIPHLAHLDGGLLVKERNHDAAEGLEGRPGVHGRRCGDKFADGL